MEIKYEVIFLVWECASSINYVAFKIITLTTGHHVCWAHQSVLLVAFGSVIFT